MDFSNIGENLPLIIGVVVLAILWQYVFRRRKPEEAYQEIAQHLLSEIRMNQAIIEIFSHQHKPRKFEIVNWQRTKNKLDFLNQSLQSTLSEAFNMAEEFNKQMMAAKKYRSTSYLESISVDRLKEPLTKSREGLEQWLSSNTGAKEPPPKYPGIFDRLVGRGG